MNNKNINTDEMLRAYFSRETEELTFNPEKKRSFKKPLLAVAGVLLAISVGLFVYALVLNSQEPMIYVSNNQNVALADIPEKTSFKMSLSQESTPTRVGLIRFDRGDIIHVEKQTKQNSTFIHCSPNMCEEKGITPDIELKCPYTEKTPNQEVIDSLKDHYSSGNIKSEPDPMTDGFLLGYYNTERKDDIINLTVTYVDGTYSTFEIIVDYIPDVPVEEELILTLRHQDHSCDIVKWENGKRITTNNRIVLMKLNDGTEVKVICTDGDSIKAVGNTDTHSYSSPNPCNEEIKETERQLFTNQHFIYLFLDEENQTPLLTSTVKNMKNN